VAATERQRALAKALHGSGCAQARLWGMKHRATVNPPKAAVGSFPYPHRTCAEWEELPGSNGTIIEREMSMAERDRDAVEGSAKLREAIERMAA
jgi:hypothetical protein